jgi:hypothetical protein
MVETINIEAIFGYFPLQICLIHDMIPEFARSIGAGAAAGHAYNGRLVIHDSSLCKSQPSSSDLACLRASTPALWSKLAVGRRKK